MDALEQFLSGEGNAVATPPRPTGGTRIPSDVQNQREQQRLVVLQDELKKKQELAARGDKMAEADAAAILREISSTSKGMNVAPKQSAMSGIRPDLQPTADPLEAFLSNQPMPTQQAPQSTAGGGRGSYEGYSAADEAGGKTKQNVGRVRQIFGDVLRRGLEAKQTVKELAGVPVGGVVGAVVGPAAGVVSTLGSGKYGTQEGIQQGQNVSEQVQKALTPEVTTPTAQAVFGGLQKAAEVAKIPPVGVPELMGMTPLVGAATEQGAQALAKGVKQAGKTLGVGELEIVRPNQLTKAQAQAEFEARQGKAGSVGAAKTEANPYAGGITGEENVRGQFPQVKLSKTRENVPVTEQATRSQIAQEILGTDQPVRTGVVTGNEDALRNEYTKAKMPNPTPESEVLKKQIANEQVALSNYAQQRVTNSGASPTLITPYERGQRINDAFAGDEGLTGFFKGEKQKLYDDASARTGNNPIQSNNVANLFADKQFQAGLGLKNNQGVAKAAEDLINHAKTVGFKDEMGNVYAPNTVGAWTAVQKSLNSNWTKDNAAIIKQINQAIERDIGQAGGLDLLKKADQLHQAEKVLFESKGIKNMFGDIDPNGVQTGTAFDSIPQKLNNLKTDEWKHIYDTADKISKGKIAGPIDKATGLPKWEINVPDELRAAAESAKNEMRGNLAREIYEAGAAKAGEWNQNSVNKILNARADKIKHAFPFEEQQAFHKLNYGGYLMPGVHGYEGAGLQGRRVQGIVEGNLGKIGTAAGGAVGTFVGGPTGGAVGAYFGGKAGAKGAEKLSERALVKAAEKTQKEMKRNAQMGQNNLRDLTNQGKK
jgi:hypothetical protein